MAQCLHKIFNSHDSLTVINYSRLVLSFSRFCQRVSTIQENVVECPPKAIISYIRLYNYCRSLCLIVSQFLSELCTLQRFTSASDDKDEPTCSEETGLQKKCHILQAKLNCLTDALSEVKLLIAFGINSATE